jgi:L-fuconate dehydratase
MASMRITGAIACDVRFPTSLELDGSDAMNPDPDYSAAYVILRTDVEGLEGHGFTFTIGFGTEICVAACKTIASLVVGADAEELFADMGGFVRRLTGVSQLRWLGPEKGVISLATAAIVNAVWDLYAKWRGLPLWQLLSSLTPEEIVSLVDFRYIDDILPPAEALRILRGARPGRAEREARLLADGIPAYSTAPGWLGYSDEKLRRLCGQAVVDGFNQVKLKVGADIDDDIRRCAIARDVIGPDRRLALDANQVWGVEEAVKWMGELASFRPEWIEEPTSPDDVLGHAAIAKAIDPIKVATGEQIHNRVMFKQFLQAGGMAVCQIDACRMTGVNEVIAVLLLAAKHDIPVCPHAGGLGLCELVVHLAAFDELCVAGPRPDRLVEWVDNLHEHFVEPATVDRANYRLPHQPGYAQLRADSIQRFRYPDGEVWASGWVDQARSSGSPLAL